MKQYRNEHQAMTHIMNHLRVLGYYVIRLNSGRRSYQYTYKQGIRKGRTVTKSIQLAEAGTPDVMAFKMGARYYAQEVDPSTLNPKFGERILIKSVHRAEWPELLFVEVKQEGEKITPVQEAKIKELTGYGARCIVATSVEDLEKQLWNF